MCNACMAYAEDQKTLKQVYFCTRGDTRMQAIQALPNHRLKFLLYELWMDFYTSYGVYDFVLDEKIHLIAAHLRNDGGSKSVH